MKKQISILLLFFALGAKISIAQEEFRTGAWLQAIDLMYEKGFGNFKIEENTNPYEIQPIDSVLKQGVYKTSRVNVLKDFGVDFIWMNSPSPWDISGVNANIKVFNLFRNHNIKVFGEVDYWFNPSKIDGEYINTIGYVDFDGKPSGAPWDSNNLGRPNYNALLNELEENPSVFGYTMGGELAYRSGHFYNVTGIKDNYDEREYSCQTSEISPSVLNLAIDKVDSISDKKILLHIGTHTSAINDYTDDFRFWEDFIDGDTIYCSDDHYYTTIEDTLDVDPQDHFLDPAYYPDYVIEGSYYELSLENDTINNFYYPMTCFRNNYSNLKNCGISRDGYPLSYHSGISCPIYSYDSINDCSDSTYGDHRHYLSKYHNIDFFRNKGIDVISEFAAFTTSFTSIKGTYLGDYKTSLGSWNSTGFVDNANHFWFNAYNSIIHGATGLIPYIEYSKLYTNPCQELSNLQDSAGIDTAEFQYRIYWEGPKFFDTLGIIQDSIRLDCNENYSGKISEIHMNYYRHLIELALRKLIFSMRGEFEPPYNQNWQDGRKNRFDFTFWPPAFQNFVSPLYNEISFLKRMGFLDKQSVVRRKTDQNDQKCLVPGAQVYIDTLNGSSNIGIPQQYISLIDSFYSQNVGTSWYWGPDNFMTEFSNENYGLRYVLLSNQDRENEEYVLIVANQLNLPILNVPINVSHFPALRDMTEAQVLFTANLDVVDQSYNLNSNYKTQRKFNFDWSEATFEEIPSVDLTIDASRQFNLNFGSLDVQIVRFKRTNCCVAPTKKVWSDLNTGRIGGHSLNQSDKPLVVGNFYDDESEEVLIVKYLPDSVSWATTQLYVNDNFTNAFNNAGNGWLNRQAEGWFIGSDDVFLSGNFINNSSGDEVLCIQDPQTQVSDREVSMIGFKDDVADWDYLFWSNISDRTKIGSWTLSGNSKYYSGNFDGDILDEVLFVRYNNNYVTEIKIQKYNHQTGIWTQVLSQNNPDFYQNSKIVIGDFLYSDGKDDIFVTNGYNAKLLKIQDQSLREVWNNNTSLGSLGPDVQPNWILNSLDILKSGKFYNMINNSDNLLLIRHPSFTPAINQATSALVYFNHYTNKWVSTWSNFSCEDDLICDWEILDDDYTKIEYEPFSLVIFSENEESLLPTDQLLALRGIESNTGSCISNVMNVRMYAFSSSINNQQKKVEDYSILNKKELAPLFNIVPNPAINSIYIYSDTGNLIDGIEVWDSYGKKLINIDVQKNPTYYLELDGLSAGLYIIKIFSGDNYYINRIIKE